MSTDKWLTAAGGGDSKEPVRTPDNLLSQDYFEILLALGEGPIKGLVSDTDTMENFFVGDTPAYNVATDKANFSDFSATFYNGLDTDPEIELKLGGAAANSPVGVALSQSIPVVRRTPGIQRGLFDRIEVRIRFDYLAKQTSKGVFESTAEFRIEYKANSQPSWTLYEGLSTISIKGKTTSGYVKDFIIEVPKVNEDYDIRVTKLSPDGTVGVDDEVASLSWESFQTVAKGKVQYPGLALTHIHGKASNQFNSLPEFSGIFDGLIVKVPTNYNPVTRVYDETVPWNGTFKDAYTNNGVWILYTLITNTSFGMARYYKGVTANRFDFYEEAKWCDGMVPDGRGGQQPRYTFNEMVSDARPGMEFLQYIAGSFGGAIHDDGNGVISLSTDRPATPMQVFTPESVTPEGFVYSFTDIPSRYNDIVAVFTNPDLNWEEDRRAATIDNTADIAANGRIPFTFVAVGCTDANEAVRRANLRYITSNQEITTVSFTTSRLGLVCEPLKPILVCDPVSDWGFSGRVKSVAGTVIQLRDPLFFTTTAQRDMLVQTFAGLVTIGVTPPSTGTVYSLNITSGSWPASSVPDRTTFSIGDASGIGFAKPFRVLRLEEVDGKPDEVRVVALEIAEGKHAAVESGTVYTPSQYSYATPGAPVLPVSMEVTSPAPVLSSDGSLSYLIEVAWSRPPQANTSHYEIDFKRSDDSTWVTVRASGDRALLMPVVDGVEYVVRLYAVSLLGLRSSRWLEDTILVEKKEGNLPDVAGLAVVFTPNGWEIRFSAVSGVEDFKNTDVRVGTTSDSYATLPTKYEVLHPPYLSPWLTAGIHRFFAKHRDYSGNESAGTATFTLTVQAPSTPVIASSFRGLDGVQLTFQDCTTSQPLRDVLVRLGNSSSTWDTATDAGSAGANQRVITVTPSADTITKVHLRARDVAGNLGGVVSHTIPPVAGTTAELISLIENGIGTGDLSPALLSTIDLITAPSSVSGSVNQRLQTLQVSQEEALADTTDSLVTAINTGDQNTLAAAQSYAFSKAETNSAIASQVNALNASITGPGGAIASAVSVESSARAAVDGYLGAQWALKVALISAGSVAEIAGIAVAGTSSGTAGARFDMSFRANAFYFLPPSGQGNAQYSALVYYPSTTVVNGVTVQAGLYTRAAFIEYITADKIDTRGLTVKDAFGNVILSSGVPLAPANADPALRNSSIAIDAAGSLTGIGSGAGRSVANNVDSVIRAPGGGTLLTVTPLITGALKIRFPQFFTDSMIRFSVDIYEYETGYMCSVEIGGYNASVGTAWVNVTARAIGGSNVEYPVYFGHDGVKCCVWIGTVGTTWSYPQVRIRDVFVGYYNYPRALWEAGWSISFDTSLSGAGTGAFQYSNSVVDTLPGADWSKTARRPSNIASLSGAEAIQNSQIALSGGAITGIGAGNGTPVANALISIAANGLLNGGGGGQVTISGLGYTGALNATYGATFGVNVFGQINSSNISTYIAGAAIDLAFINTAAIVNLAAIKAFTGSLYVDGDLEVGTLGRIRSGKTAYGSGTGYIMEYNGGTPRLDIGSSDSYLRWTGAQTEQKNVKQVGAVPPSYLGSMHYRLGASGVCTAQVYMNSDGRIFARVNGASPAASGINWYDPTTSGIGLTHWVRYWKVSQFVSGSGGVFSLTIPSAWVQISADTGVTLSKTFTAAGLTELRIGYQIAADSGGARILSSGQFALEIGYEP